MYMGTIIYNSDDDIKQTGLRWMRTYANCIDVTLMASECLPARSTTDIPQLSKRGYVGVHHRITP